MNKVAFLLIAGLWLAPGAAHGALTAHSRLVCYSLRFQQGSGPSGLYTLDLTTLAYGLNGELSPLFGVYSHWSYYELYLGFDTMSGTVNLDTPAFTDADGNGFDDFFEVSQGVAGATSGIYDDDFGIGGGTIQAQWNRAAGAKDGTCVLTLTDDTFGELGSFTHSFALLEYAGPLTYTPGSDAVTGSLALAQTGAPAFQMQGPFRFAKMATNRFDQLVLQPGVWTNAAAQSLVFTHQTFYRDLLWPTNYYGYVEFNDGHPDTGDADYQLWLLSIDDTNDSDHDGIPNFTDDPRRPALKLSRGPANLWLAISGDPGFVHRIQAVTNVLSTNWQPVAALSLTNDPQSVSLPLPPGKLEFWRVLAE